MDDGCLRKADQQSVESYSLCTLNFNLQSSFVDEVIFLFESFALQHKFSLGSHLSMNFSKNNFAGRPPNRHIMPSKQSTNVSQTATVVANFVQAVRVPGTTFSTLQVFLDALSVDTDCKSIVIELSRQISGKEVAGLLNDATKMKAVDIALVFTVLEKILLTITSEIEVMESFALEMTEQLMTKHIRTFYYMLKTTNKSNQIKSALKLLISGKVRHLGPRWGLLVISCN